MKISRSHAYDELYALQPVAKAKANAYSQLADEAEVPVAARRVRWASGARSGPDATAAQSLGRRENAAHLSSSTRGADWAGMTDRTSYDSTTGGVGNETRQGGEGEAPSDLLDLGNLDPIQPRPHGRR